MIEADLAIIGAGVAGCIASIALAPSHRVLLIDKDSTPHFRIGENLPPPARRILRRLDLLNAFNQQCHLQSQGMQSYWGSDQPELVDHLLNPDGFGWFLDRQAFELFLREAAASRGAKTMWPERITLIRRESKRWLLNTNTDKTISVNYVIDAGGRQSPFARQLGVRRHQADKLVACWATLPDNSQSRLGLIAAAEDGWWYSAPIPGDKRVVAFQSDSDLVRNDTRRHLEGLLRQARSCAPISKLFAQKGDSNDEPNAIHHGVRSANSSRLERVVDDGWAAIGDAALSFDPLSSQGMYNAMVTAMQLAELLRSGSAIEQEYSGQIEKIWGHYRNHQLFYYRKERRWQGASFWERRH